MIVNITKNQSQRLMLVDLDTGTVIGTNVRLVHMPDHAVDRLLDDDNQAIRYAAENGVDLLVDSEQFVGADMLGELHPVPDHI